MSPADRLRAAVTPSPRVVDWSLLALAAGALATGVVSLGAGHPSDALLFVGHGALGVALAAVLAVKLRRVRRRVTDRRLWDPATPLSILTAVVVLSALGTGTAWALGAEAPLWGWTLLNLHIGLGLLAGPLVLLHLRARYRPLRRRDVDGRRDALRYAGLLLAGAVVVRGESLLARTLDTPAARARFTGSRPVEGEAEGNDAFPVTSWVADDPDPVDPETWRLRVDGLVDEPLSLGREDLSPDATDRALLDCTSGWYTVQDWRGVRLGDLLDEAAVQNEAQWVTVWSVTGYRWSFPLGEARGLLLATRVGGEALSHGHGAPLRLVAPDRRGFQWVKWVERVEVRRHRDATQYLATLVSGL
ncbi:MAG: molybdopterin-dependent oxidoreductase [Haloferacaceae archaeon]